MFGVGAFVGVLTVNWLGSIRGKLLAMWVGLVMACLHAYLLVVGIAVKSVPLICGSMFLGGASHIGLYVVVFLMMEKYGSRFVRMRVSAMMTLFNNGLFTGVFSVGLRDW